MSNTTNKIKTELIVITGGPGAGKTAVIEMAKKILCEHSIILPEAASIIFGGGFWRLPSISARSAAQRAIFHVQNEMENLIIGERKWAMGLCDRGTLDGFAYWPTDEKLFWEMSRSSMEQELNKYLAVIHLRSPSDQLGYNHINPLRTETAIEAKQIDDRIAQIWSKHPHYEAVESTVDFMTKANTAMQIIAKYKPGCCQKF